MTWTTTSIVLFAWLAQSATPAKESENKTKAKALVGEGSSLYKKGDYVGALEAFQAAYAAFPSPKLWFNIGQANRDLGRPVEALSAFEKFVGLASDASTSVLEDAQDLHRSLAKEAGTTSHRVHPCWRGGQHGWQEPRTDTFARHHLGHTWPPPIIATRPGAPIVIETPALRARHAPDGRHSNAQRGAARLGGTFPARGSACPCTGETSSASSAGLVAGKEMDLGSRRVGRDAGGLGRPRRRARQLEVQRPEEILPEVRARLGQGVRTATSILSKRA